MTRIPSREESVDRFLKASEELMCLGSSLSGNIDSAFESFKQGFATILRSHFLEKAVAEMLAKSFSEFEKNLKTNLKGIDDICTEGGQWYAFCFGTALGRPAHPPTATETQKSDIAPRARAQGAPYGRG